MVTAQPVRPPASDVVLCLGAISSGSAGVVDADPVRGGP
jgi:hypothetical protein